MRGTPEAAAHQPLIDVSDPHKVTADARLGPEILEALQADGSTEVVEHAVLPVNFACPNLIMQDGGVRTGISDAADITSWDPPFPVDLKRVRPKDEDYWDRYRAAPKAIISLEDGQRLWGSRYGRVSSIRFSGEAPINAHAFDPADAGFTARMVRADALCMRRRVRAHSLLLFAWPRPCLLEDPT